MAAIPWVRYAFVVLLASSGTVSGMLVPPYLHARDYDFTAIGFLAALTGVAALGSRFPAGAMYRRDRARAMTTVAIITLSLAYLAYPLAGNVFLFSAVQLMVGLANGVATTINLAMFMDTLPRGVDRSKPMAMYAGALAGGHTVGNLIGGFAGDTFGYVAAFQIGSATTLLSLFFLWGDRFPAEIEAARKDHDVRSAARPGERLKGLLHALAEPQMVAISLVAFLLNFLHGLIGTFFPLLGVSIGLSLTEIGLIRSVHSLANTVARPLAAAPIQQLGPLRASYAGLIVLALFDTLLPSQTWVVTFALLMVGIGLMRAIVLVGNTVQLAGIHDARISRGMASSVFHSSQDIGMLSSPALCGAIASLIGLTTMMAVVPLASAAAFFAVVALLAGRQRRAVVAAAR